MYLPLLFGMFVLMIFLEALTDALVYLAWMQEKVIYGILNHISQIFLLLSVFIFGYMYEWDLWSLNSLYAFFGYLMFRFGFFDLIFGWISGLPEVGKSDIFDILLKSFKLSFWYHASIRIFLAFVAIVLMIIFIK